MDFRILGPLEVEESGRAIPLGGPKQRALLTILLLNARPRTARRATTGQTRVDGNARDDQTWDALTARALAGPARIVARTMPLERAIAATMRLCENHRAGLQNRYAGATRR